MAAQRQTDDSEVLRQIGETWDSAKSELAKLRETVERTVQMGEAQASLQRARSDREIALLRLGEAFYKLADDGSVEVPAALKRAVGEVKAKDAEVLRQQADIAAILKEADALVEKSRKAPAKKKTSK